MAPLITLTPAGLYCEAGDFHIDPWRPVDFAVVTHAHSDHARWGSKNYLVSERGLHVARERLPGSNIESLPYGRTIIRNGVSISLHPAGHILGSALMAVTALAASWVPT